MFNFLDISSRMYCFMNKLNIYFHFPESFVMMLQIDQKALYKALLALLDLISSTVFYHLIIPVHKEWFLIPRILSHFLTVALRCFLSVEILFTGWQLILLKGTNKKKVICAWIISVFNWFHNSVFNWFHLVIHASYNNRMFTDVNDMQASRFSFFSGCGLFLPTCI